jgi:hypothetical protein
MEQFIVPSPAHDDWTPVDAVPVELARSRQVQGRVFRKHILNKGPLIHPKTGARIDIDDAFVATMRRNFADGVCDIVQVPVADAGNRHVETPLANIGEVVGIEEQGNKVYALIDAREHADKLGKTFLGASAFLSTDYTDTRTGRKAGPTLLHVAVTNRPYVTGLEDYEEVVAATADNPEDTIVVLTPEDEMPQTREELIAALKEQHGIDVEALQAQATQGGDLSQLTAQLSQALAGGGLQFSGGDTGLTADDIVGAISELAELSRGQAEEIGTLRRERAEAQVDGFIGKGRLLPKSRDRAVELVLSGDTDALDAFLAPENDPYVKLAAPPAGVPGSDQDTAGATKDIDAELARLTSQHGQFFTPNGTKPRG